ncbi:MAG TPA: 1,4-dihydroxy-6-naphthoate synthase [Bacteroidales bacterium]|nr:1,4-dihydroxy-6-naphthoate synthase [Bacteroidales bacterium]
MLLTLGFSPCPNDTFIFDAMVHGKIDTEGLEFSYVLADVEELNKRAFNSELDVTKVSFNAFLSLTDKYLLLDSGSALGFGVGPLVVSRKQLKPDDLKHSSIAIPGINTTANLLLTLAVPEAHDKKEVLFSSIEQAVLDGDFDAGLIIHESRFTYAAKGLKKVADLGEYWEELTGSPIPLGGITARRGLTAEVCSKLDRVIRRSVEYSFAHLPSLSEFVSCNAQEMSTEVMRQHIDLYVNRFTLSLGEDGRKAVKVLFDQALQAGVINNMPETIFA